MSSSGTDVVTLPGKLEQALREYPRLYREYHDETKSTKLAFDTGDILFGKIRPYFHKVGVAPVDGVASTDAIVIVPRPEESFAQMRSFIFSLLAKRADLSMRADQGGAEQKILIPILTQIRYICTVNSKKAVKMRAT